MSSHVLSWMAGLAAASGEARAAESYLTELLCLLASRSSGTPEVPDNVPISCA